MWDKLLTMTREPAERLLNSLARRAAAGSPTDVQCHALCLAILGRTAEAVWSWERLLSVRPHSVAIWLNLAKGLVIDGRLEQAVAMLERCRDAMAAQPNVLTRVDERLADLREMLSHEENERRLAGLQVAAVRWRLDHGQARLGDRLRLARLLDQLMLTPGSDVTRADVLVAARAAHGEAPTEPATLEFLASLLLERGPSAELDEVTRALEQVAPHSRMLEVIRRLSRDDPEFTAGAEALQRRHEDLIVRAMQDAADAEPEIRDRLRGLPDNPELRIALIYAVCSRGDEQEALRMADQLAAELDDEHVVHFYLGQLLWDMKRRAQARHHFARAMATAQDEQDRVDLLEMMRVKGALEAHGNG